MKDKNIDNREEIYWQEHRKKIYRFFDYNPYDYRRLYLFNKKDYINFSNYLSSCIRTFYNNLELIDLLNSVPVYPVYRKCDLKEADCLLITHEPALYKGAIEKIYGELVADVILQKECDCANYMQTIKLLNHLMDEAMISWLAMNPHHYTGEINGDKMWSKNILRLTWKKLGKLGYFFRCDEQICIKKCLHFDLFLYPKENKTLERDKTSLEGWLNGKDINPKCNTPYTDIFLKKLLTEVLKQFIDCNTKKYICIIANYRAKISKSKISYNNADHSWLIFHIVKKIISLNNNKIEIRFIDSWPSMKNNNFTIYKYRDLDPTNKEIFLNKYCNYDLKST